MQRLRGGLQQLQGFEDWKFYISEIDDNSNLLRETVEEGNVKKMIWWLRITPCSQRRDWFVGEALDTAAKAQGCLNPYSEPVGGVKTTHRHAQTITPTRKRRYSTRRTTTSTMEAGMESTMYQTKAAVVEKTVNSDDAHEEKEIRY